MDNKDFKKHLRDLAHGHHHPEEHDWSGDTKVRKAGVPVKKERGHAPKANARTAKTGKRAK